MDFINVLNSIINTLGSTVLLPIFIFIFAVALGAKVGRAFRASVTIAVAFIGINLVIGLMLGALRLLYDNIDSSIDSIWPVVISGLLGFFIILVLIELRKRVVVSSKV